MSKIFFNLRCPDCRGKITEDDALCPHCGADLNAPLADAERRAIAKQYAEKARKTYDKWRNLKSAIRDIDLATQFEPESAEYHNLRGLILDASGKTADAINSYREAIRLDPTLEDAKVNLMDAKSDLINEALEKKRISSIRQNSLFKVAVIFIGMVTVICGAAEMGFIYLSGRDLLGPKKTIIFEPDYPQISAMDSSTLKKTAEILTTRARNHGYSNVSFSVTNNSRIIGKVPGSMDTKKFVEKISPMGLLEFVDFGNTQLPEGTIISTDLENIYIQKKDEKQWHTIMTNEGIYEAGAVKNQTGEYAISFSLNDKGQKIFADHTTANIGSFLGIVLDKVVMSAPIIHQPIIDGQGMISGTFTLESAHDLAIILKTTPLPIPIKLVQITDSEK
jgi:preprotein translocase subunit SecD